VSEPVRWYAIHTRSRFEKVVAAHLSAKAVENYLPSFEEVHQWRDRKKKVEMPAFPGYVFARFADGGAARLKVLKTPGAVRILGGEDGIEAVPDREIDAIRRLFRSSAPCFSHPFLREGAWVRVRRGPLQGLEGLLVRAKNRDRLVLSIDLLSQSVATEIDASDVEVIRPVK